MNKLTTRTLLSIAVLLVLGFVFALFGPQETSAQVTYSPGTTKVVRTVAQTGLTTALAPAWIHTAPASGMYRTSCAYFMTQTGSAGTIQPTFNNNNGVLSYGGNVGGALNVTITTVPREFTVQHYTIAGGTFSVNMTFAGVTGSPIYSLYCATERLF
jgi:hypothetical protein